MLDSVKEMLKENTLCVLCTAGGGLPYCSLMTYVMSDDLKTVYMVTVQKSKKYRNLLENSSVSLLVDNRQRIDLTSDETVASVTFGGVHRQLDPLEIQGVRTQFALRHAELKEILNHPDAVILGVALKSFLLLSGPVDSVQGDL